MTHYEASKKHIDLNVQLKKGSHHIFHVDDTRISQILVSLITSLIKFSEVNSRILVNSFLSEAEKEYYMLDV